MNTPDLVAAISPIVDAYEQLSVSYSIVGSVASSAHGIARATLDADLVADLQMAHVDALVDKLSEDYYIDRDAASDAIRRRSMFNLVHLQTMLKVDAVHRMLHRILGNSWGRWSDSKCMNPRLSLVIGLAAAAVLAGCKGKSGGKESPADDAAVAQAAHDAAPAAQPPGPPPEPVVARTDKGDCSTDYAPNPERDRFPMCKIAGGTFMMGSDAKEAPPSEGPPHKVTLSPYLIDQFEVTVAQYVHYLNDLGDHRQCGDPFVFGCVAITEEDERAFIRKDGSRYRAIEGKEHHPVTFMSWPGAKQYCEWVGKRLPTEAEWEFAAIYDRKTKRSLRYPWGNRFFKDRSNCTDKPCSPGTSYLLPIGSFDGTNSRGDGTSPWGVHDMLSNASEWVADCYDGPYKACEPTCKDPGLGNAECKRHILRTSIVADDVPMTAPSLRATLRSDLRGDTGSTAFGFRCAGTLMR